MYIQLAAANENAREFIKQCDEQLEAQHPEDLGNPRISDTEEPGEPGWGFGGRQGNDNDGYVYTRLMTRGRPAVLEHHWHSTGRSGLPSHTTKSFIGSFLD